MIPQTSAGHQSRNPSKSRAKKAGPRNADYRDAEVGRRVRSRRMECGLTQTVLAEQVGITFQQIQKYEKGVNRIGAGRLQRLSEALKVPISFFFDGQAIPGKGAGTQEDVTADSVFTLVQSRGAVRLLQAFSKITSPKAKQTLIDMAEVFSAE